MPTSSTPTTATGAPNLPNRPNISLDAPPLADDAFLAACLSWITRQATSGSVGSVASRHAPAESYLLLLLAMNGFTPASGILLDACLRAWKALIEEGPQGSTAIQRSAVLVMPIRDEGGLPFGHGVSQGALRSPSTETRSTPQEPQGEPALYESLPTTKSGKLPRYLDQLDAASRLNLERHLGNPAVSSAAICNALRECGFVIGRTTVTGHRRHLAAQLRSDVCGAKPLSDD